MRSSKGILFPHVAINCAFCLFHFLVYSSNRSLLERTFPTRERLTALLLPPWWYSGLIDSNKDHFVRLGSRWSQTCIAPLGADPRGVPIWVGLHQIKNINHNLLCARRCNYEAWS